MATRILLLLALLLAVGCSRDKTKEGPAPAKPERLPAEVEKGPEDAIPFHSRPRKP